MAPGKAVSFDFGAPGELFCARGLGYQPRLTYKRFDSAAKAIQFAMEVLPSKDLRAATLEVAEIRMRGEEIRLLYQSAGYPLVRKAA